MVVGVMVENGLLSVFKEAFETVLQAKVIQDLDTDGRFERNWNYFTYANMIIKNGHENDFKKLTIKLQDIWVVFSMLSWLGFSCILIFLFEVLSESWSFCSM